MTNEDVIGLNIPTGVPLVYELDNHMKPIRHYCLGDPAAVARKAEEVAKQGTAHQK
ncbi:MAG: hypothetical protein WKF84_17995 [Pyrinomonadaceae bacterium]